MTTELSAPHSPVEKIKQRSNYLRGTIVESLADEATGSLAEDDTQLSKFHGLYQQDDRDVRNERTKQKLEPAYRFMIRVRVPGGIATPKQWLAMDALARTHANGTLRLTTRQAFQFHGVIKSDLKTTIRAINDSLLDTIAA
jgi:sulfite reductase (NADPH) hemoprotein beta-component